ncbi:uncharacterized protein [Panulirus ornatus]|uniref:uncharacterized protein n=1 Tax=Panulirus ornatus TaxID=150431 RepID=UPI003A86D0AD
METASSFIPHKKLRHRRLSVAVYYRRIKWKLYAEVHDREPQETHSEVPPGNETLATSRRRPPSVRKYSPRRHRPAKTQAAVPQSGSGVQSGEAVHHTTEIPQPLTESPDDHGSTDDQASYSYSRRPSGNVERPTRRPKTNIPRKKLPAGASRPHRRLPSLTRRPRPVTRRRRPTRRRPHSSSSLHSSKASSPGAGPHSQTTSSTEVPEANNLHSAPFGSSYIPPDGDDHSSGAPHTQDGTSHLPPSLSSPTILHTDDLPSSHSPHSPEVSNTSEKRTLTTGAPAHAPSPDFNSLGPSADAPYHNSDSPQHDHHSAPLSTLAPSEEGSSHSLLPVPTGKQEKKRRTTLRPPDVARLKQLADRDNTTGKSDNSKAKSRTKLPKEGSLEEVRQYSLALYRHLQEQLNSRRLAFPRRPSGKKRRVTRQVSLPTDENVTEKEAEDRHDETTLSKGMALIAPVDPRNLRIAINKLLGLSNTQKKGYSYPKPDGIDFLIPKEAKESGEEVTPSPELQAPNGRPERLQEVEDFGIDASLPSEEDTDAETIPLINSGLFVNTAALGKQVAQARPPTEDVRNSYIPPRRDDGVRGRTPHRSQPRGRRRPFPRRRRPYRRQRNRQRYPDTRTVTTCRPPVLTTIPPRPTPPELDFVPTVPAATTTTSSQKLIPPRIPGAVPTSSPISSDSRPKLNHPLRLADYRDDYNGYSDENYDYDENYEDYDDYLEYEDAYSDSGEDYEQSNNNGDSNLTGGKGRGPTGGDALTFTIEGGSDGMTDLSVSRGTDTGNGEPSVIILVAREGTNYEEINNIRIPSKTEAGEQGGSFFIVVEDDGRRRDGTNGFRESEGRGSVSSAVILAEEGTKGRLSSTGSMKKESGSTVILVDEDNNGKSSTGSMKKESGSTVILVDEVNNGKSSTGSMKKESGSTVILVDGKRQGKMNVPLRSKLRDGGSTIILVENSDSEVDSTGTRRKEVPVTLVDGDTYDKKRGSSRALSGSRERVIGGSTIILVEPDDDGVKNEGENTRGFSPESKWQEAGTTVILVDSEHGKYRPVGRYDGRLANLNGRENDDTVIILVEPEDGDDKPLQPVVNTLDPTSTPLPMQVNPPPISVTDFRLSTNRIPEAKSSLERPRTNPLLHQINPINPLSGIRNSENLPGNDGTPTRNTRTSPQGLRRIRMRSRTRRLRPWGHGPERDVPDYLDNRRRRKEYPREPRLDRDEGRMNNPNRETWETRNAHRHDESGRQVNFEGFRSLPDRRREFSGIHRERPSWRRETDRPEYSSGRREVLRGNPDFTSGRREFPGGIQEPPSERLEAPTARQEFPSERREFPKGNLEFLTGRRDIPRGNRESTAGRGDRTIRGQESSDGSFDVGQESWFSGGGDSWMRHSPQEGSFARTIDTVPEKIRDLRQSIEARARMWTHIGLQRTRPEFRRHHRVRTV